ncbi:MAG TPA: transglutaminase family protein [Chthoniobacteraceae bacterium]|jgi:uncharacterized protein (DUF2126 family)|nr:transglutaminase family protein [Chthoniobacteraceae bacterium]
MTRYHTFDEAAKAVSARFQRHKIKVTLGGEPSYIPVQPDGAEWIVAALGPTKLSYARAMAAALVERELPGAIALQSQGKFYPGEPNARWALHLIWDKSGKPIPGSKAWQAKQKQRPPLRLADARRAISKGLGIRNRWHRLEDTAHPDAEYWVLPLDHDGKQWMSRPWALSADQLKLIGTEGPAGLRLPLHLLPEGALKRALVIEKNGDEVALFFPPLLQRPFLELLEIVAPAACMPQTGLFRFEGYVPEDGENLWTKLSLTPDPGVLEINLPPCNSVQDYAWWLKTLDECAAQAGMRSFKSTPAGELGTGGGNHLLFGGPSLDENAFFKHPRWVTAILRYWQAHPALSYLFTGVYVGSSSQAPRPDESARDHYDLEMAYRHLESLDHGQDHRYMISETLRHLHIDLSGNSHRSEISFDKFWNLAWESGCRGLIEFRAIETLPHSEWMSAIALLWTCLLARLFEPRRVQPLAVHGILLHDYYFLPTGLWSDFELILRDLARDGFRLNPKTYRDIWDWRCPLLLDFHQKSAHLTVRKALEGWPLLCETPMEGGSTSRFVDTSMERLELLGNDAFFEHFRIYAQGREVPLARFGPGVHLAGLRYRATALYPSLHPGMPPHLPLHLTITDRRTGKPVATYQLPSGSRLFAECPPRGIKLTRRPCRKLREQSLTFDLRLA